MKDAFQVGWSIITKKTTTNTTKKRALQIFDAFVSTVIFMDNKSFFPRLLLWGNKFRAQNNNAILCF